MAVFFATSLGLKSSDTLGFSSTSARVSAKLSRLSGKISDCLKILQSVWKLSRVSRIVYYSLETFHIVQKLSRVSRNFSRLSKQFSNGLKTFPDYPQNNFQKLSRVPKHIFPEVSETVQKIPKVSGKFPRWSRNFLECPETFKKLKQLVAFFTFPQKKYSRVKKVCIKQCLTGWKVFLTMHRPAYLTTKPWP